MEEQKYSMDPFAAPGDTEQQSVQQVYVEQNDAVQQPVQPDPQQDEQPSEDPEIEKKSCVIMAIIFAALVLVGIGAWYYLNGKSEPAPQPPATAGEEDKNFVKANSGAHLYFSEGLEIIIPAGALEKDTKIDATVVSKADPDKGEVTDLYHLMPDGLRFQKPVTLLVPYKSIEGFDANDTELGYRFTNYGQKQLLEYEVETNDSGKKLRTQVDKF